MKKIVSSVAVIALVAVASIAGTMAFYTDTAESNDNTFNTGTLDLKLDLLGVGGGFHDSFSGVETPGYDDLTPGGDEANLSAILWNDGSSDSAAIGIAASHSNNNIAAQMRITKLNWKGNSMLEGGAGANIGEYVVPTNCDTTISSNIQTSITNASSGEVVCVEAGTYNADLTIDKAITLVALNAPDSGDKATIHGRIDVTADDVTIRGFEVTNQNGGFGVVLTDVTGGVIDHNVFTDIGSGLSDGSAQAVYLDGSSAEVTNNTITIVGNTSLVANGGSSAKGIYIGDTSGSGALSGVTIENNHISDVKASTAPWNSGNGGRGAYGILINHGGSTDGASISHNTITDLEGLWSHAIGLEGDTPNASVTYNDISDIVDHKGNTDAVAVFFEANPSAMSVVVNNNNLVAPLGLAFHPDLDGLTGTLDATNNWWGTFTPSSVIFDNGNDVDSSSYEGGPVVGFVNGTDSNGNGYADLHDLAQNPIENATPGLDAGETGQLDFLVQLDGPTTGNSFQGNSLSSDFTYTLGQIAE